MILKEISLINIPPFNDRVIVLTSGPNDLGMNEGSIVTIAVYLHSVFSLGMDVPAFVSGDTSSEITVKFQMESKACAIVKKWEKGKLIQHNLFLVDDKRQLDLTDTADKLEWCHEFLKHYDRFYQTGGLFDTDQKYLDAYAFIISLVLENISVSDLSDGNWSQRFLGMSQFNSIETVLSQAQNKTSIHLGALRDSRQKVEASLHAIRHFEHELAQVDSEIARIGGLIDHMQTSLIALESEYDQTEKVHEYVISKKSELEKADFEIRSYRAMLRSDMGSEFSDDEIVEINEKSRLYESILKQEESLAQKRIEQKRLEKNLQSLLTEVAQQKIEQNTDRSPVRLQRIDEFESEISRIKQELKTYQGIEKESKNLREDKSLHRASYEKFHAIKKLKQVMDQKENRQIQSLLSVLEQEREERFQELERMQSGILEDRYRLALSKVQQKRQQIAEQKNRQDVLFRRRLQILREYESSPREEQDLAHVESAMRKHIEIKRYLSLLGEFLSGIQNELIGARREAFSSELNKLADKVSPDYIRSIEELIYSGKEILQGLHAEPEFLNFESYFRSICLIFRTRIQTVVLSNHRFDRSDSEGQEEVIRVLNALGYEQIIF